MADTTPDELVLVDVTAAPARTITTRRLAGSYTERLFYLDHLKAALIIAVVVFHVAITYGANGSWYYIEDRGGIATEALLTVLVAALQFFFMGLFFAIAGYFTPPAYDRKGARRFLADRLLRLGIPLVIFATTISPVIEGFKTATSGGGWGEFWPSWRQHLRSWTPGPLWFVETLLIFSIGYVVWRLVMPAHLPVRPIDPFTSRRLLTFMTGLVAMSFFVRLRFPIGAEFQHLQLAFYPQYVAMFVIGIVASDHGWLSHLDIHLGRRWLIAAISAIVAIPIVLILGGAASNGGNLDAFFGGVHWQALVVAILEAVILVGMSIGLIVTFRDRFGTPTPLWTLLAKNAYAVYIIHPPVVIGITYACRNVPIPSLLKFVLLAPVAVAASFALCQLVVRRVSGAARVL